MILSRKQQLCVQNYERRRPVAKKLARAQEKAEREKARDERLVKLIAEANAKSNELATKGPANQGTNKTSTESLSKQAKQNAKAPGDRTEHPSKNNKRTDEPFKNDLATAGGATNHPSDATEKKPSFTWKNCNAWMIDR